MLLIHRALLMPLLILLSSFWTHNAEAQSPRQRILACWQAGAMNTPAMQACSGLIVDTPTFHSCMSGGPCFGEAGVGPAAFPGTPSSGAPFCGAPGQLFCPQPRNCGQPGTIWCPPPPGFPPPPGPAAAACGALGFPPCGSSLPCGVAGGLPCSDAPLPPPPHTIGVPPGFGHLNPNVRVTLPATGRPGATQMGASTHLARPPLPKAQKLRDCARSSSDRDDFYECVAEEALPAEYRITRECLLDNQGDGGAALACSTGRQDLVEAYERYKEVRDCNQQARGDDYAVAQCLGDAVLGQNERYYLRCVTQNRGRMDAAAVCALAKDLNPEQQIALACAVSTGGQPHAFAACTGGQLLERELNKCWEHGIGTDQGCFGPNNEYRRFLRSVDDQMRSALGDNSAAYHAYKIWQDNVLAPGPNHEVVRALNNGINDVRNGPGPNNEFVKAGRAVEQGVRSVAKAICPIC